MEILTSLALSLHLGMEGDYNAFHPHIRIQEQQYVAGVYFNSEEELSPYAGYRFEYNDFGLEVGAVGNYAVAPVLPYVRGTYKNFFITPGAEIAGVGIVVGIEIPIGRRALK